MASLPHPWDTLASTIPKGFSRLLGLPDRWRTCGDNRQAGLAVTMSGTLRCKPQASLLATGKHRVDSDRLRARRRSRCQPAPNHALARLTRCRARRRDHADVFPQVALGFRPFAARGRVGSSSYNDPTNKVDPLGLRPNDSPFSREQLLCIASIPGWETVRPGFDPTNPQAGGYWWGYPQEVYWARIDECARDQDWFENAEWIVDTYSDFEVVMLGDQLAQNPCDGSSLDAENSCAILNMLLEAGPGLAVGFAGNLNGIRGLLKPSGVGSAWSFKMVKDTRVYQRNSLFDPQFKGPDGRTNIQRMQNGDAPTGTDGKPINLHHMLQKDGGPLIEVTQTRHQESTKILHINPRSYGSAINRPEFRTWRRQYWELRACDFVPC